MGFLITQYIILAITNNPISAILCKIQPGEAAVDYEGKREAAAYFVGSKDSFHHFLMGIYPGMKIQKNTKDVKHGETLGKCSTNGGVSTSM
jgi:hypothetical protein